MWSGQTHVGGSDACGRVRRMWVGQTAVSRSDTTTLQRYAMHLRAIFSRVAIRQSLPDDMLGWWEVESVMYSQSRGETGGWGGAQLLKYSFAENILKSAHFCHDFGNFCQIWKWLWPHMLVLMLSQTNIFSVSTRILLEKCRQVVTCIARTLFWISTVNCNVRAAAGVKLTLKLNWWRCWKLISSCMMLDNVVVVTWHVLSIASYHVVTCLVCCFAACYQYVCVLLIQYCYVIRLRDSVHIQRAYILDIPSHVYGAVQNLI